MATTSHKSVKHSPIYFLTLAPYYHHLWTEKNEDPFQLSTQSWFGHKTNVYNSCVILDNIKERGGGRGKTS